ncbi:uncharacterized protein LOC132652304 isoform X2 [Meriones unguiculatus]|uniref:uncharacterized protein LOC132652304 isoform X2 n=1 Tax=Meriones unguiculatus TaxID=10047 RepID=UPI00293E0D1B|nr:uncharacterized protein LOC132652304 isoform X2 [Meriones unguiculatus]
MMDLWLASGEESRKRLPEWDAQRAAGRSALKIKAFMFELKKKKKKKKKSNPGPDVVGHTFNPGTGQRSCVGSHSCCEFRSTKTEFCPASGLSSTLSPLLHVPRTLAACVERSEFSAPKLVDPRSQLGTHPYLRGVLLLRLSLEVLSQNVKQQYESWQRNRRRKKVQWPRLPVSKFREVAQPYAGTGEIHSLWLVFFWSATVWFPAHSDGSSQLPIVLFLEDQILSSGLHGHPHRGVPHTDVSSQPLI